MKAGGGGVALGKRNCLAHLLISSTGVLDKSSIYLSSQMHES